MRSRYVDIDDASEDFRELLADEPEIAKDFLVRYELSWLYHDCALEGVVLSNQELAMALARQVVAEATSVNLFREVQNHRAVIDLVRSEAAGKKLRINLTLVKKIYETFGTGIEAKSTAEYRKEIPLHRAYFHEIAQPAKIPVQLAKVLDACDSSDFRALHPIQQAARIGHGFMQVYPFTENSGKVARMLSNLVLLHNHYLPCVIHATDRQRYYESLRGPETTLREVMLDSLGNALANGEKYVREAMANRSRKTAR